MYFVTYNSVTFQADVCSAFFWTETFVPAWIAFLQEQYKRLFLKDLLFTQRHVRLLQVKGQHIAVFNIYFFRILLD